MGRKKVDNKNKNVSISLTIHQAEYVKKNKDFDLSKFVQLCLQNHIDLDDDILHAKVEGGKK